MEGGGTKVIEVLIVVVIILIIAASAVPFCTEQDAVVRVDVKCFENGERGSGIRFVPAACLIAGFEANSCKSVNFRRSSLGKGNRQAHFFFRSTLNRERVKMPLRLAGRGHSTAPDSEIACQIRKAN